MDTTPTLPSQSSLPYLQPATAPPSPSTVSRPSRQKSPSPVSAGADGEQGRGLDGPQATWKTHTLRRKQIPLSLLVTSSSEDQMLGGSLEREEAGLAGVGCGTTFLGRLVPGPASPTSPIGAVFVPLQSPTAQTGSQRRRPSATLASLMPDRADSPAVSSVSSASDARSRPISSSSFSPFHPPTIPLPPLPTDSGTSRRSSTVSTHLASPFQSPSTLAPPLCRRPSLTPSAISLRPPSPSTNPPPHPPPTIPLPQLPQGPSGFRGAGLVPKSPEGIFAAGRRSSKGSVRKSKASLEGEYGERRSSGIEELMLGAVSSSRPTSTTSTRSNSSSTQQQPIRSALKRSSASFQSSSLDVQIFPKPFTSSAPSANPADPQTPISSNQTLTSPIHHSHSLTSTPSSRRSSTFSTHSEASSSSSTSSATHHQSYTSRRYPRSTSPKQRSNLSNSSTGEIEMTPRKRSSRAGASEGSTRTDEEAKDDEAVKELKEIIQAKDSGDLLALGSLENEEGDPDSDLDLAGPLSAASLRKNLLLSSPAPRPPVTDPNSSTPRRLSVIPPPARPSPGGWSSGSDDDEPEPEWARNGTSIGGSRKSGPNNEASVGWDEMGRMKRRQSAKELLTSFPKPPMSMSSSLTSLSSHARARPPTSHRRGLSSSVLLSSSSSPLSSLSISSHPSFKKRPTIVSASPPLAAPPLSHESRSPSISSLFSATSASSSTLNLNLSQQRPPLQALRRPTSLYSLTPSGGLRTPSGRLLPKPNPPSSPSPSVLYSGFSASPLLAIGSGNSLPPSLRSFDSSSLSLSLSRDGEEDEGASVWGEVEVPHVDGVRGRWSLRPQPRRVASELSMSLAEESRGGEKEEEKEVLGAQSEEYKMEAGTERGGTTRQDEVDVDQSFKQEAMKDEVVAVARPEEGREEVLTPPVLVTPNPNLLSPSKLAQPRTVGRLQGSTVSNQQLRHLSSLMVSSPLTPGASTSAPSSDSSPTGLTSAQLPISYPRQSSADSAPPSAVAAAAAAALPAPPRTPSARPSLPKPASTPSSTSQLPKPRSSLPRPGAGRSISTGSSSPHSFPRKPPPPLTASVFAPAPAPLHKPSSPNLYRTPSTAASSGPPPLINRAASSPASSSILARPINSLAVSTADLTSLSLSKSTRKLLHDHTLPLRIVKKPSSSSFRSVSASSSPVIPAPSSPSTPSTMWTSSPLLLSPHPLRAAGGGSRLPSPSLNRRASTNSLLPTPKPSLKPSLSPKPSSRAASPFPSSPIAPAAPPSPTSLFIPNNQLHVPLSPPATTTSFGFTSASRERPSTTKVKQPAPSAYPRSIVRP